MRLHSEAKWPWRLQVMHLTTGTASEEYNAQPMSGEAVAVVSFTEARLHALVVLVVLPACWVPALVAAGVDVWVVLESGVREGGDRTHYCWWSVQPWRR